LSKGGNKYPKHSKKGKANWIGHILRRNCLLKPVIEGKIEGKIEVMKSQSGRGKKVLDDLKETRGYWKLKEEAVDYTLWRTHFGRGYGPGVRDYGMNDCILKNYLALYNQSTFKLINISFFI
jgi:hypothetical protein